MSTACVADSTLSTYLHALAGVIRMYINIKLFVKYAHFLHFHHFSYVCFESSCRKYFNRHFLCNSLIWTCELTGQANLTYSQALQSEKEARKVMDSLPECFQKAALSLVHHVRRTNIKMLADEVCTFYRLRFVEGEELGMRKKTSTGAE